MARNHGEVISKASIKWYDNHSGRRTISILTLYHQAGWVGKGKTSGNAQSEASAHVSRPLSTLKDPSSFGPPPKHIGYHGGVALPDEITPHRGGLGAPLTEQEIDSAGRASRRYREEEIEEQTRPAAPALPYRADRTGLQTSNLPPPPVRRDHISNATAAPPASKPGLPPRLPSRQNTTQPSPSPPPPAYEQVSSQSTSPQPPSNGTLNQNVVNRLGSAGINVPSLGIGAQSQSQSSPPPQPLRTNSNTVNELQARFARMTSNSAASTPAPTPAPVQPQSPINTGQQSPPVNSPAVPSQGTTWAEKQSALRTAQNLRKDPSTVSATDARNAANTLQNFRERHADKITAGKQKAQQLNKRYQVTDRLGSFLESVNGPDEPNQNNPPPAPQHPNANSIPQSPELAASISRKPPPPPPPKKPAGMQGQATNTSSSVSPPPPVPLGTRPSYS